jgi:hypothetical protein
MPYLNWITQLELPRYLAPGKLAPIVVNTPGAAKRVGSTTSVLIHALTVAGLAARRE